MKTTTPAFVSVPDAAAFLGISRGLAYEQAREYLDTGGERGLVCVRLGHRLLVPTAALERLASCPPRLTSDASETPIDF